MSEKMKGKYISVTDYEAIDMALHTLAIHSSVRQAHKYLADQGYRIELARLKRWRDEDYAERFEEIRSNLAPRLENTLANDMLATAREANEVARQAIETTRKRLNAGKIEDSSRVARDLSQVSVQSVDKRLALQGRPTHVTEHRNIGELVNALVGLKVAEVIEAAPEDVEDADVA
jgi:hypothetical protein